MSAPKLTDKPAESLPVPRILKEVSRRIVGQDAMVERLLVGMLTGGHILLEGVPGLAKTLAVRTLSEIINASFSRIQFTPDLLPADLIGTMVYDQKTQEFHVKKGPLFAQIILAARSAIAGLYMDQKVVDYIVDLVRATREPASVGLLDLKPLIAFGGSPRASIALAQAGRAHAFLRGRNYVVPEDVRALAPDVLRHRIVLTFEAEAEDVTTDDVVSRVLGAVKVP